MRAGSPGGDANPRCPEIGARQCVNVADNGGRLRARNVMGGRFWTVRGF
jgi:hypothetical protein